MGSISDIWASFETLDPESDQIPRIQSILHNADWEYLITQAVQLRQQEQPESSKTLTCSVDTTRFTCGFNNLVVALTFSDSVQWIARVALPQENEDDKAYQLLLSEIATMRLVRARTTIPIAEIFAFGPQTDDFGFAFILMEALPGRILDDRLALSVPAQYMKHFVTQLATYVYELSCVKFEKIGCIVPDDSSEGVKLSPSLSGESRILSTSLEYFYRLRKRETKAILKAHKGEQQFVHQGIGKD
ncbi:phosphotransferase family protein [Aspergillus stella-maris]|uniref:phosphotransferase family protein n=1 Tax=Aspergillus stella-maris TaxID=1810926 RepID=UPI003CCD06FC